LKLTKKDFVGPFPASVKPVTEGLYWSAPIMDGDFSIAEIFNYGNESWNCNSPDTCFKKGQWKFKDRSNLTFTDRQWIGLTKAAAKRVAREMGK
jgi:hypothetical protein